MRLYEKRTVCIYAGGCYNLDPVQYVYERKVLLLIPTPNT